MFFKRRRLNRIRAKVFEEAVALGYDPGQVSDVMGVITESTVDSVAASIGPECAAAVGAIGDGTIIQAIIDFFKSPAGQALIQALVQLIIGMLI